MFKRILVAVDGSAPSDKALDAALAVAREHGGRVRVLHVAAEMLHVGGSDSDEVLGIGQEAAARVVGRAMATAAAAGIDADKMLFHSFGERLGDIVANAARSWGADLVVVGSHGRQGAGDTPLGSGAGQIIRAAPVPVLVVR
ncbi:universal stress protein [Caenimonas terrae]|uniref:Universal stress protein n=1 Tax=Caenimonas terrae TaxID=696074 RepID=A0ABW0NFG8_9BURK